MLFILILHTHDHCKIMILVLGRLVTKLCYVIHISIRSYHSHQDRGVHCRLWYQLAFQSSQVHSGPQWCSYAFDFVSPLHKSCCTLSRTTIQTMCSQQASQQLYQPHHVHQTTTEKNKLQRKEVWEWNYVHSMDVANKHAYGKWGSIRQVGSTVLCHLHTM